MFFFKTKTLSTRQTAVIGFVLALIAMLVMAVTVFVFPILGAWLNQHGVISLDLYFLVFCFTVFCATEGLILFGFPLYYAQDKKSHMTGFRILVFAILWMILMMGIVSLCMVGMAKTGNNVLDYPLSQMSDGSAPIEVLPAE
jgi:hypothetical protein